MADIQSMCWIIPESIDLEAILKKDPPNFKYKIDYFYYFVDLIVEASDLEDLDNDSGYVKLEAKKLQSFARKYNDYLDYLRRKFVNRSKKYIVGKESFGYCISLKSDLKGLKAIPIIDFKIRQKLKKLYKEEQRVIQNVSKKHYHLTKWFNKHLTIEEEKARQKVDELLPYKPAEGMIWGEIKGRPSNVAKRYKALSAIQKFVTQDFYYSVDENIGRFHSNVANIKKELRAFIRYDGQKLVNIDIKNSQPLFSTLLLSEAFYNKHSKYVNIYSIPSILQLLSNPNDKHISFISHYIMIVKSSKTQSSKEFKRYNKLVYSGDFYKKISSIIAPKEPFDKSAMKTMMFMVFFSSNRFIGQPKAQFKRLFRAHFPEVYEVFKRIKKGNHAALSHLLQRIESNIIVELASRRIAEERPEVPIFTVHDSIATTLGNEEYIEAVIKEEIFSYTGLKVKLGREYWTD